MLELKFAYGNVNNSGFPSHHCIVKHVLLLSFYLFIDINNNGDDEEKELPSPSLLSQP